MAAFAASDVTVTITERWRSAMKMHARGTIAFGNATLTYPTGGVPLPAVDKFGVRDAIDVLDIVGLNGLTTDYLTRYDKTNHKLLLYEEEAAAAGGPLLECDVAEAPAARVYDFYAIGR